MIKDIHTFSYLRECLLSMCKNLKRIPTKDEINCDPKLPTPHEINLVFKKNGYYTYSTYLRENGYKTKSSKTFYGSFADLCEIFETYRLVNGKYPNSRTWELDKSLPSWARVKKICGDRYEEFCEKFNINSRLYVDNYTYEELLERYKTLSREKGSYIKEKELAGSSKYSGVLPRSKYFIENCPDKNVKNFADFLVFAGFKPSKTDKNHTYMTKEEAIKKINEKREKLGRNLMYDDFRNPKNGDVGITTVKKYWGTLNNMLRELEMPINQENMISRQRPIEEMKDEIKRLCEHIKNTEGRTIISYDDINKCQWCTSSQQYNKYFGLVDYIHFLGFETNKEGVGTKFTFDDGEQTKSNFEYRTSIYLRSKNIKYERNVKYKEILKSYGGSKDCDYKIYAPTGIWFVEIAGMIHRTYKNSINNRYLENLKTKEDMLIESGVRYKIIFSTNMTENLDEVFSFLFDL